MQGLSASKIILRLLRIVLEKCIRQREIKLEISVAERSLPLLKLVEMLYQPST
jgi:hypothetical protein